MGLRVWDDPTIRTVEFPLTEDQLLPLDPRCSRVQFLIYSFSSLPTEADLVRLSDFLSAYPKVALRVVAHTEITDLDFLQHFPFLESFDFELYGLKNLDGLRYLPENLRFLFVGQTKGRFSLKFLTRFPQLETLFVEGHSKDFEAVGTLKGLRDLTLRSITVPSLEPLTGLSELWSLDIKLGGTKNLEALHRLPNLKYLELWMIRGLNDLDPIADVIGLQYLFLKDLARVTRLPAMRKLNQLRRVDLVGLRALRDLSPLMEASSLEELHVYEAGQMQPEDFAVLRGHPALQRFSGGAGSLRKTREIKQMLGLPQATRGKGDFDFR